jgi:serine/threonine protein kinase
VAFEFQLPINELELPTGLPALPSRLHNLMRFYCLGIGRSSILELHQLKDSEFQSLQRQNAKITKSDRLVGLKKNIKATQGYESLHAFKQEVQVLGHIKLKHHENIATALFIGFDDSHSPMLGLELAVFSTLVDVLLSCSLDADETLAFKLALDVATGMAVLHSSRIIHGDIKLDNILVYNHLIQKVVAKLTDFSDLIFVQDLVGQEWQPLGGTHSWRAPEYYDESIIYGPYKTNVYSFGLCALAVLAPGDQTTKGSPADCFLDRIISGRELRQEEVTEMKILSDTAVINSANGWLDRHTTNSETQALGHILVLTCLNRNLERRLDSTSIVTLLASSNLGHMSQHKSSRTQSVSPVSQN